jgi:hypothetical protein
MSLLAIGGANSAVSETQRVVVDRWTTERQFTDRPDRSQRVRPGVATAHNFLAVT